MKMTRNLVAVLALFGSIRAIAAPPPFGEWMVLRIKSCQPVVFEAPDNVVFARAESFEIGERRRVTLVEGEVVSAKNFTTDGKWNLRIEPPAAQLVGKRYVGFVDERVSDSCPSMPLAEMAFVRVWGCDVGGRGGACMPPFPQLRPVREQESFNFVLKD
jgi:hypothetical protein